MVGTGIAVELELVLGAGQLGTWNVGELQLIAWSTTVTEVEWVSVVLRSIVAVTEEAIGLGRVEGKRAGKKKGVLVTAASELGTDYIQERALLSAATA